MVIRHPTPTIRPCTGTLRLPSCTPTHRLFMATNRLRPPTPILRPYMARHLRLLLIHRPRTTAIIHLLRETTRRMRARSANTRGIVLISVLGQTNAVYSRMEKQHAQAIHDYRDSDAPSGWFTHLEGRSGDHNRSWRFGTSYEEPHTR